MDVYYKQLILLYERLLEATERENEMILNRNINELEKNWEIKGEITAKIDSVPMRKEILLQPDYRNNITSIINRIQTANKINSDLIKNRKDELMKEIAGLHLGKKAVKAYNTKD